MKEDGQEKFITHDSKYIKCRRITVHIKSDSYMVVVDETSKASLPL